MKITVITAVFNREDTIASTCEAIASQCHADLEWVVVDGGSTDGTLEVLENCQRQPDVFISERDGGIYEAINKGLKLATGEVVGLLHSDDFYPDTRVIDRVAEAFKDEAIDAAYGDLEYVWADNPDKVARYWKSGVYDRQNFCRGWMPPHPTFFMRRLHYEELGGFDLKYRIAADYDSVVRYLWTNRLKAAYIPAVQMRMRTGGASNRSLKNILLKMREDRRIAVAHGLGSRALVWKNISKVKQLFRRAEH